MDLSWIYYGFFITISSGWVGKKDKLSLVKSNFSVLFSKNYREKDKYSFLKCNFSLL